MPDGKFDIPALLKRAQDWPGLEGMDLARVVSRRQGGWEGGVWTLGKGYARSPAMTRARMSSPWISARRTTSSAAW
jgi:carbamoyl-phosphate synthase small subunit